MCSVDIEELLRAARAAGEAGDVRAALEVLEQLAGTTPTDPSVLTQMGFVFLDIERFADAIDAFDRAITADGMFAAAHSGRAQALQEQGRLQEAEAGLRTALLIAPTPERWVLLGDVQSALFKDALAEQSFHSALALDPQNDEALFNLAVLIRSRDPGAAVSHLTRALAIDPLFSDAHRELGLELLKAGLVDRARHELETALQLNGQDAWALVYLGLLHWRNEHIDGAATAFLRASEVRPLWSVPEYLLGLIDMRRERPSEAQTHFDRATRLDPRDANAAFNFGRFLADVGRKNEAAFWLRRALEIDPECARASTRLALLEGT